MKASYITNLVLFSLIVLLLWWNYQSASQPVTTEKLSALSADEISDIHIHRPNHAELHLQKEDNMWLIVSPFSAPANTDRVKLILALLDTRIRTRFPSTDNLHQYGLQPSQVSLQLNQQQFEFGEIETLSKQRYLLHNQEIMLFDDDITPLLNSSANIFIDNRLIAENGVLNKIELTFNHQQLTVSNIDGHWQSQPTFHSADSLTHLIDSWQHAYATQVRYVDKATVESLPSPQIYLWFRHMDKPIPLVMTETDTHLLLTNPLQALQYRFPKATKHHLIPDTESN